MRVTVVGGGPGGSRTAELLSRQGARVLLYECRPGWEKPCGGGVPERGLDFCPFLADPSLAQRRARVARIYSPSGREAVVPLSEPLRIYRRSDLNGHLLKRAENSGVDVRLLRIVSLRRDGRVWKVTDAAGHTEASDFLVGADGASGVVRGRLGGGPPPLRQSVGIGYYLDGLTSDEIILKFFGALDGYLWVFPRPDHLAVGICGPTGAGQSETLMKELERFLIDRYGTGILRRMSRYGARIPSLPPTLSPRDTCQGDGWALVGDAAGLVDPLTREGIHYALASGQFLAEALAEGTPEGYPRRWEAAFGGELEWAGNHKELFYSRRFIEVFTLLSSASPAVGAVVSDLVAGRQEYCKLKRRLTACAPAAGLSLLARFLRRPGGPPEDASGPSLIPV